MKWLAPIILTAAVLGSCASGPDWTRRSFTFSVPADPPTTNSPANLVALNRVSISPVFQGRAFTYRTADNSYEQDPYAGFLIPPERALAETIRAWMRASGAFGHVVEPGSGLTPTLVAEAAVSELYGDFRKESEPLARMELHFVFYEVKDEAPGRVVLDRVCARATPLARKTPEALMAAWDTDLQGIMEELNVAYAKATVAPH